MSEVPENVERYLLVWFSDSPIERHGLRPVRRAFEDNISAPPDQVQIDLWLESPGGDAHTAYKLALLLRHYAGRIRVIIPEYAKSAATLLALVGNEIFMAPSAELGPLDAQLPEEGSLEGFISALDVARAADEVSRDAVGMAIRGGADLLNSTNLSRSETLKVMLQFSAQFSEPLVRQLDPKSVHSAKQMLKVTQEYAAKLLTPCMGDVKAWHMATHLVQDFPSHGFVIDYSAAQTLDLPVRPLSEYEFADSVKQIHRDAEDASPRSTVMFGLASEIAITGEEEESEEDEQAVDDAGDRGSEAEDVSAKVRTIGNAGA